MRLDFDNETNRRIMRLYIDVETYRHDAFKDEEAVAICALEDWSPYKPESAKIDPE